MTDFVVLKFGGTSVATKERWETIRDAAQSVVDSGARPVLVCSAVAKVTNALEALLTGTLQGDYTAPLEEIRSIHRNLAADLGVEVAESLLDELEKLALGASLVREVTPRLRARVLGAGELLSTRLGAAFLQKEGLDAGWLDARSVLRALEPEASASDTQRFLSARCSSAQDIGTRQAVAEAGTIVVTQGFIARNERGETVLLGRGGSDTSAAYFAARLAAKRCEIWTDVPGVYSADPRAVPAARLLKRLDYEEAQEIASCGAKVLHPRCLEPVARAQIPLHIRCTPRPDAAGTVIGPVGESDARVKAISAKSGITLVSMNTLGMWQQAGFLADAFAIFKTHGVSVDLISTSEANVTVSIDVAGTGVTDDDLAALLRDLAPLCQAKIISNCAAVSLVGRRIRALMHQLGPALGVFEEKRIHLISQAANDLNLTFVVDEDQAERMVRELHALLFADPHRDTLLGATWKETFSGESAAPVETAPPWWATERDALLDLAQSGTPTFVYNLDVVTEQAQSLLELNSVDRVLFAMKANNHPAILRRLTSLGVDLECVSPGEIAHVDRHLPDLDDSRLLFTPNFAPKAEVQQALDRGRVVTVDNVHPIEQWPAMFDGKDIMLRLDPGRGAGHHAYVKTAGKQSKFGVAPDQLDAVTEQVQKSGANVVGLHAHAGSGIRTPFSWRETALFLTQQADRFGGTVQSIDVGGGLGVPEKPGDAKLPLAEVDAALGEVKTVHPFNYWMEPGRFLVATAGVILATVTQVKRKGDLTYVGIDAGMHTLIRPALYGAFHEIVNLTRLGERLGEPVHVVGPICETGDTLGYSRPLPPTQEGDVLLIATAGAYGRVMSSQYNLRPYGREVILDGGKVVEPDA